MAKLLLLFMLCLPFW